MNNHPIDCSQFYGSNWKLKPDNAPDIFRSKHEKFKNSTCGQTIVKSQTSYQKRLK